LRCDWWRFHLDSALEQLSDSLAEVDEGLVRNDREQAWAALRQLADCASQMAARLAAAGFER